VAIHDKTVLKFKKALEERKSYQVSLSLKKAYFICISKTGSQSCSKMRTNVLSTLKPPT
jgi:hypothetical protein